ncbi:unnamed protein product, partial [Sphagnum compactum]
MNLDLNMVPKVDSGMQQDRVVEDQSRVQQQAASAAAAAPDQADEWTTVPVYVVPALLYFGQIPVYVETVERFRSAFGSSPGSTLDLRGIQLQEHPAAATHENASAPAPFQTDIMMSEVASWPAYGWSPKNPGFAFPVPHYHGQPAGVAASEDGIMISYETVQQPSSESVNASECVTDDVDAMQSADVTNSDDDDEGSDVHMGTTALEDADHVHAPRRCMCEICAQEGMCLCMCEECFQKRSMMPVHDDGGRVRSYNREYPDQLSMVLGTGDGGRQDIEDVAHHEPPLSSVVEEGSDGGHDGSVAAFFQQLQLHDHGSESDTPANDDVVDAQAAEVESPAAASTTVAAVLQQSVPAEKKTRAKRKSKVVIDAAAAITTAPSHDAAAAATTVADVQHPVAAVEKKKRKHRKSKAAGAVTDPCNSVPCNPEVADHDPTVVVPSAAAAGITTDVVDDPASAPPARKKQRASYRRGPPSKSSEFLGITHYRRTGRWEAHICSWIICGVVIFYSRAYDKAALVLRGEGFQDRINFKPSQQYQDDVRRLKLLTKDQMALFLRRDSKGPGAVSTYPCVRKIKGGKFEATYRENWKRRRAVYDKAVQENNKDMARLIKDTSVVRSLPTTAQQAAIDAGLPVPSAQKPVTRRRGKQKAPKKPYTPRKKKATAEGAAAKRPRKPYTPRKKKDVVPAGATAAAENEQTLQHV